MSTFTVMLTVTSFLLTLVFLFWRPRDVNEAIPASVGALLVLLSGSVTFADLGTIASTVGGAAITILATMVMANVLESFGFFQWAAELLASKARGSGIRLFWLVNLLCFLMTLFFNNDGSILITTPILLILLKNLGLKPHQQIPYLMSGAIIATASSAPIGVSNIVNLIALKIVGMSLYMHTAMMFVPATLGLLVLLLLMFLVFYKQLPKKLPDPNQPHKGPGKCPKPLHHHPLKKPPHLREPHMMVQPESAATSALQTTAQSSAQSTAHSATRSTSHSTAQSTQDRVPVSYLSQLSGPDRTKFMRNVFLFVFAVRVSLFIASYVGLPVPLTAVLGSVVLLIWRWYRLKIAPTDLVKKTPWYILVFAFSMYVIIYGLHKIGLTEWITLQLQPFVTGNLLHASLLMGGLVSVMSDLFNNHPALMVGTLTLTNMHLSPLWLKVTYLATVIGSDMGSLLLPIGTLATLMWMHICKKGKVRISWKKYMKVTIFVIPVSVVFTLVVLYYWVSLLFQNTLL
ncbi:MAG: arsenic transporter [Tumebacillaceae bacterium]